MNQRTVAVFFLTTWLLFAPISFGADDESQKAPITLSNHPQLFLDDYLLAETRNIKRALQQPTKHPANPLPFEPEYPWEESRMSPGCVLYDEEREVFRMWYQVLMDKERYADNFAYTCYAESPDAIHWTKPMMELHDFEGQLPTNILSKGPSVKDSECLRPSVIVTPHDPERPYKMLFTHRQTPDNRAHYGLNVSSSTDGIHWTEPTLAFGGKCDNPPSLVWSPPLRKYFGFCRAQDNHTDLVGHIRSTGIITSDDFDSWTPRKKVVLTDERDGYPFVQFHHLMVTQYGDLMIGMADVMHMLAHDNKTSTEDVQLICSRDGWNWTRVADRAVFIPNGPECYDWEMVSPRSAFVQVDDVIYIFYKGSPTGQASPGASRPASACRGKGESRVGMCIATLPAERFVALVPSSTETEGIVRTVPFDPMGRTLLVNAELSDPDDLQVEVLDGSGGVLPNYERDRSELVESDPLRYRVVWREHSLPKMTDNKPVALRFLLRSGALYSFRLED